MVLLYIIIAITVGVSLLGFNKPQIVEQYKFHTANILYKKEYVRLLSSGFFHADYMHLFFNMMTLYFFGPILIQAFGPIYMVIIYILSILLGNLFSLYLYQSRPWYTAIGASGGVSGVLFSSIALVPDLGIYMFFIPIAIPGYIFGTLYFGYSVYMMLYPKQWDNLGHSAHLGGAFLGLVAAVILSPAMALENINYLGIMSLPLLYLAYEIIINKKIG